MDNALSMRMIECLRHLRQQRTRRLDIQYRFTIDARSQRLPLHIPHYKPAQPATFTEGVQRHNTDMLQAGHRLRFPTESFQHAGVSRRSRRQHLDRHQPLERAITRQIHRPHTAAADQPDNLVFLSNCRHECVTQRVAVYLIGDRSSGGHGFHAVFLKFGIGSTARQSRWNLG